MEDKKTCADCLHCKVSSMSTKNCRFCFCSQMKHIENRLEVYWNRKPVCKKFNDMTA